MTQQPISIGLARMHQETGERRDFLPDFAAALEKAGARVVLEHGYGCGMGVTEQEYTAAAPRARFAPLEEVYRQDIVIVLRWPGEEKISWLNPEPLWCQ